MDFITLFGIVTFVYSLFYIIASLSFDCDIKLKIAEIVGKSIDTLAGKVVWVTGASSGIGKHLAIALATHNVRLVLSSRKKDDIEKVKILCLKAGKKLTSDDILVLPMDVTNEKSHATKFQEVIDHFGSLDILVNNAGRSQRAAWENITTDVDREIFNVNVFGVMSLTRLAVSYFMKIGQGHVAVTSSVAGIVGAPFSGSYTGTKWAIHGYFNSLRSEKMQSNLKVTLLCPGPTFTNFLAESFTDKVGEKFGQSVSESDRRMTAERCGELCAVALANQLDEAWIAIFPIISICYVAVYFPNLAKMIFRFIGAKEIHKLRDTNTKEK